MQVSALAGCSCRRRCSAYRPELEQRRNSTAVSTGDWESYAHFAVADRAQRDGRLTQARHAYYKALDYDRTNTFALLNLAGLSSTARRPRATRRPRGRRRRWCDAAGGGETDKDRLDFAQWL